MLKRIFEKKEFDEETVKNDMGGIINQYLERYRDTDSEKVLLCLVSYLNFILNKDEKP